ncbi:cupin domain-containing protein [Rhizobium puerariae]|uniref:Cupin domain-containing protein n=1 Tax=Rhizobium puerariae TaxID=1585791 RepID=A0ABV6ABH9_9HYPH
MPDGCQVSQTGFARQPFHTEGRDLIVDMVRMAGESREPAGPEEVVAVLEGTARIDCGDESFQLPAGSGLLIAAGLPRRWDIEGEALVYRVRTR